MGAGAMQQPFASGPIAACWNGWGWRCMWVLACFLPPSFWAVSFWNGSSLDATLICPHGTAGEAMTWRCTCCLCFHAHPLAPS